MSPLIPASNRLVGSSVLIQFANEVDSESVFVTVDPSTLAEAAVLSDDIALVSTDNRATRGVVSKAAKTPAAISKPRNNATARRPSLPTDLAPEPLIAASRCVITNGKTVNCNPATHSAASAFAPMANVSRPGITQLWPTIPMARPTTSARRD